MDYVNNNCVYQPVNIYIRYRAKVLFTFMRVFI